MCEIEIFSEFDKGLGICGVDTNSVNVTFDPTLGLK